MARPWKVLARWSDGGQFIELRQRGDELAIVADDRELTNSHSRRRCEEIARLTLAQVKANAPRVLVVGLQLGFTLHAALDVLPAGASVVVCEPDATIVEWCRYAVADMNGNPLADPRVSVVEEHGGAVIARSQAGLFDAVLLDLYWGPSTRYAHLEHAYFGAAALELVHGALWRGGALGVWSEAPDAAFATRLAQSRFAVTVHEVGEVGRKNVVYVGQYL